MPKKSRFKYKVGQSVKFRFYDGSVHNGIIVKRNYRNEDTESLPTQWTMPVYTVHSPDNSGRYPRGYMSYPSITESMIKHTLDSEVKIVPMKDYVKPETPTVLQTVIQETDDLEDAITKQKQFIDGRVKQ
tara:strand:+ start:61 stop:450 length:390 start_codon:yes stop_codon:yes gene_type:complete